MNKTWLLVVTATALCIVSFAICPAPAAAEYKIGYVNMQRALEGSKQGSTAQRKYKAEVQRAQSKLNEKKQSFERLRQDFDKARGSLSDKARLEREESLRRAKTDVERNFQDSEDSLRRMNAKIVGELAKKMRKVIQGIGKRQGYTMILEKENPMLLYATDNIDLTDQVIQEFDRLGDE